MFICDYHLGIVGGVRPDFIVLLCVFGPRPLLLCDLWRPAVPGFSHVCSCMLVFTVCDYEPLACICLLSNILLRSIICMIVHIQ